MANLNEEAPSRLSPAELQALFAPSSSSYNPSSLAIPIQQDDAPVVVPLNEISIRIWDLNENSTRYDSMVAARSDKEVTIMFASWAAISLVTLLVILSVFIPVVCTRKMRTNPFHVYLIFIMVTDILLSFLCFFTCLFSAIQGHYHSSWGCEYQSFYVIFCICANAWLNAVVAYQLYTMLRSSSTFRRYKAPTTKKVIQHVAYVYIYAAFVASWPFWKVLPHKTRLVVGASCLPMDYDLPSTLFFYFVFTPALLAIPTGYVVYVAYQIYKRDLLPPQGRRRILAIFFFRLTLVFILCWTPTLVLLFIAGPWVDPWVAWFGGDWGHLQGAFSAMACLLKDDIRIAVKDFWFCTTTATSELEGCTTEEQPSGSLFTISRFNKKRRSKFTVIGSKISNAPRSYVSSANNDDTNKVVEVVEVVESKNTIIRFNENDETDENVKDVEVPFKNEEIETYKINQ